MRRVRQGERGPRRSAAKERFWRGHIARQKGSGMSIRDYCARHALSEPSFYAWRAELARRDGSQRASGSAPERSPAPPRHARPRLPQFVRLDLRPAEEAGLIEIVLGNEGLRGAVVRVPPGADRATLERVLAALAAALRASANSASEGLPC
jgi:hypothetical protein